MSDDVTTTVQASAPPAVGVRLDWPDLPEQVRAAIEARLGGRVVEAVTQRGGFSPGLAARLLLADGRRAFVKAVSARQNPESPDFHRAEARISAALPVEAPVPRLLTDFEVDGYVVLAFEDIDGATPEQPWRPADLRRVVTAVTAMAKLLDPSPIEALPVAEQLGDVLQGWRRLLAARDGHADDLAWLDPWARRNLERLAGLEAGWGPAATGTALAHADLRADNVLLTADRVVVVDWPGACIAAPWFDLVVMAPSVWMQGGPELARMLTADPLVLRAEPGAVASVVAALAGMFLQRSREPAPPRLPTLRAFQAGQGQGALAWLRELCDWA